MLTRKRLPNLTLQTEDGKSIWRALSSYFLSLEDKGALAIDEANIRAANGIVFPATQNASTDANTLDDYEEGADFKSSVTDGSGATLTLTKNVAKYLKIGGGVLIHLDVTYPVTASGAAAQLNGMPFTEANHAIGALYNNGAGGGTVAQMTGAVVNFYTNAGVAITNANLSGATIRTSIFCMT